MMIATPYQFNLSNTKLVEKIIEDDHAAINHVILPSGEALPQHSTNSFVYLIIIRGAATIQLEDEAAEVYLAGSIVHLPYQTTMNLSNQEDGLLEFFIVKSPSPHMMRAQA